MFVINGWPVYGQTPFVNPTPENKLYVSFENGVMPSYEIILDSNENFILSQSYSWIRDQNSRYNLASYSIDGSDFVPISRLPRGNFTIDIPTDSSHSIVFFAVTQYPVSVKGSDEFSFFPQSPTNDNWFDADSEVTISVSRLMTGLIVYEVATWEGQIIKSDGNSALIRVDSPTIVEVKWKENYLLLLISIIIPGAAILAFFSFRKRVSKVIQKQIKPEIQSTKEQVDVKYYSELSQYLKLKSLEKLDLLLSSNVISEAKHLRIKEKLEPD